jgi:SRSO17 transposase
VSAKALALGLPKHAWRTITWRDGSADPLRSRFARVRGAHRADQGRRRTPGRDVADRVAAWRGRAHQVLANVAKTISFRELVDIAKMRWRIERDYQDLKQEIGLCHYEGRGWRGFHHHGTLCIAASGPRSTGMFAKPAISGGYRPRGAAAPAPTQSRPSIAEWCCRAAHAAPAHVDETCGETYDAVVLGGPRYTSFI